ncbi:MAG: marine proteobacterial sortase target protein [Pyrinomonadaceae bacterium]|nr:marine proteobacterial sortase target protein [Pyrinomonadaceae bacterium]
MRKAVFLTFLSLLFVFSIQAQKITQGELSAVSKDGKPLGACPLKHTDVKAEISGFLSRVKVTQEFENNFTDKIEAVYVFPLPNNAAVDDMTMKIGERTVRGKIMKREEAREVYETAKSNGQIASLLDQERPNIFTQAVANILPGEKVIIEISYVETLKYEAGTYEFVFPMVVGPRYIPGTPTGQQAGGFAPDTDKVPDGSRITPQVAKTRAGHDISLEVKLDAGVPVESVVSKSHQVESAMLSANSYSVKLKNENTIPNKDFILRYDVAGKKIEDAVLLHRGEKGGYFSLILQPPDKVDAQDVTPKEIVFVVDTSGSMEGFPLDKAKESMKMALNGLNPQDTFNLITFAGDTAVLFEKPVSATPENLKKAWVFMESRQGGGGTEMMKAIRTALDPSDSQQHVRIVCFMTDGYVGNEAEILSEIQKHQNARIFSFGIGSSVNRYLLDKMAEEGRGEVEYVSLNDDGSAAAKRFHERVRNPLLTDISVDFGNLKVADVYPQKINDLFSAKPVVIQGRFTNAGSGVIKLKGKSFGREIVREIPVNLPENEPLHDVLATLWARTRIDDLTKQDYQNTKPEIKEQITSLGIEYRLMTQFTSFVAVEERVVTDGGQPRKIEVPVELPEGVSREGIFGDLDEDDYEKADRKAIGRGSAAYLPMPTVAVAKTKNRPNKGILKEERPKMLAVDKDISVLSGEEQNEVRLGLKANVLPKAVYPAAAKTDSVVKVELTLDAKGNVVTAKAISGDKSFFETAEASAKTAKYTIPQTSREIKKITGIIIFDFKAKTKSVTVSDTLQNLKVEVKPNKYQSSVKALVERLNGNQALTAEDLKFVKDGKAEIIVRVSDLNAETVNALKAAGFEVLTEMASSNAVVGKLAVEKLAALAELDAVTFISAQNR